MRSYVPYDAVDALVMAQAVQAMREGSPVEAVAAILAGGATVPFSSTQTTEQYGRLQAMLISMAGTSFLLIGGAQMWQNVAAIDQSWFDHPNENPGEGQQTAIASIALATLGAVGEPVQGNTTLRIGGYSAGAASAGVLGPAIQAINPRCNVIVYAFNPPRPVVREWAGRVVGTAEYRFHCDDDPVSHFPIWSSEIQSLGMTVVPWRQARADRYVMCGQGISLDFLGRGGFLVAGDSPTMRGDPLQNAIGWVSGQDNAMVQSHSLPELIQRLRLFTGRAGGDQVTSALLGNQFFLTSGEVRVPPQTPIAEADVRRRGQMQQYRQASRASGVPDPDYNTSRKGAVFFPSDNPYWAGKVGSTWWVWWRSQPMFDCATKAVAKRRATYLNRTKETCLNSANGVPGALGASLAFEGGEQ